MLFSSDVDIAERIEAVGRSVTFTNLRATYDLESKRILDIGCGFGEYLKHFGRGSVGITTTAGEVDYGYRAGMDIRMGNAEALDELGITVNFDAMWANNLFEHLLAPHSFLMFLRPHISSDGILILGVPMVPRIVSLLRLRWFRGALATNHINFFTKETFRLTVERAGWDIVDLRPFIFKWSILDRALSGFSPHLYLIAKPNRNFRYPEKKLKEWIDDPRYKRLLALGGHP